MKRESADNRRPKGEPGAPEATAPGAKAGGRDQILNAFTEIEASFTGLKQMQMEAARRETELAERAEQLDYRRADLEARLEEMTQQRGRLTEERDDLQRERQQTAREREELKTQWQGLQRALKEAEEKGTKCAADAVAATERAQIAERRASEANRNASRSLEEAAVAQELAAKAEQQVSDALKRLEETERSASSSREGSEQSVADVYAQLASASEAAASQKAECERLRKEVERQAAELKQAKEALTGSPSPKQVEKNSKAVRAVTEKLDEAQARIHFLEEELASPKNRAEPGSAYTVRRRARLKRYRQLLQTQGRKIIQAQNALGTRHAECDAIMAQRGRLATALVEIQRREQRAASFKARTAATVIVFYGIVSLAVLGVASWAVAGKFAPATYAARATVEVDPRGRKLSPEELKGWQEYHEQLLEDPQLMETAAERMERRGILEFAKAPQLREKILKDLYVQNTAPGKLIIELRDKGAEHTAVVLDTYINALVATANGARGTRPDGLPTIISQVAKPVPEPISDRRMPYALSIFGGAGVLMLGVSALLGGRLARVKRKADIVDTAADALDENAWKGNDQVDGRWNTDATRGVPRE
jgi:hypothetical protein